MSRYATIVNMVNYRRQIKAKRLQTLNPIDKHRTGIFRSDTCIKR